MKYHDALHKLNTVNQSHLLNFYNELNELQKKHLIAQIEQINLDIFKRQQQLLKSPEQQVLQNPHPFPKPPSSGNQIDFSSGKKMISEGLMGCLLVAGGQGTRLRANGPKGTFPITPQEHKSLFQIFAEKSLAAGKQAKRKLPLAIMTSPANHKETIAFFEECHFFGLDPQQVTFFSQGVLPILDTDGNLFLESKYNLATGPDGNGLALHHFFESGLWSSWHQLGISAVNFIVVDNPLADPYDAELLGYHQRMHNDITIKCVSRKHAQEKVGVLAQIDHHSGACPKELLQKTVVVEYSELPNSLAEDKLQDGSLLFPYANISLFCFDMDFIKKIAQNPSSMPLHKAFKSINFLDTNGFSKQSLKPNAWKFETFIFDLLPQANKVEVLLYPREQCFSPLKNFEGDDSIATVQKALDANNRRVYLEVTGKSWEGEMCEISQEFYYPLIERFND